MLASVCGFAVMATLVKFAGRSLPAMQLVLARVVVTFVLGLWTVKRAGLNPFGNNTKLLLLRGAAGTTALCAFYYALTTLPMGDATAIQYTNPVLTALLGALFLGEAIRRADVVGALLSVGGVLLIARPTFLFGDVDALPIAGLLAASLSAVMSAVAYVTVRALRRTDDPLVIVFWFPLVASPIVIPWALSLWVPPTPIEWGIMLTIGIVTHASQIFLTRGMHLVPAGRASAIGYLQVVLAFIIGMIAFSEVPSLWNISGAALIVGGTIITSGLARRPSRTAPTTPA